MTSEGKGPAEVGSSGLIPSKVWIADKLGQAAKAENKWFFQGCCFLKCARGSVDEAFVDERTLQAC